MAFGCDQLEGAAEMIIVVAVLLLQVQLIPKSSTATVIRTSPEITGAAVSDSTAQLDSAATAPHSESTKLEDPASASKLQTSDPFADSEDTASRALLSLPEPKVQDSREKPRRREWLALVVAEHSAATFDAWSTRRALSGNEAQELNPTLRPFVGNDSIYAAVQVGPVLFDYIGRRMMTSHHGWARHSWWVLQAVSAAASLVSGAHNLSLR
jgi:hypothetical protein